MTRAFVRIFRDDKWQNIEVDQLSDPEWEAFAAAQGVDRGWLWAKFLGKWIRDNVGEPLAGIEELERGIDN